LGIGTPITFHWLLKRAPANHRKNIEKSSKIKYSVLRLRVKAKNKTGEKGRQKALKSISA
jgi:hypothetical protein